MRVDASQVGRLRAVCVQGQGGAPVATLSEQPALIPVRKSCFFGYKLLWIYILPCWP